MAMRKSLPREVVAASLALVILVLVQYLLGIFTLINYVPVSLGSIHQGFACLVLLCSVYLVYIVRTVPEPREMDD